MIAPPFIGSIKAEGNFFERHPYVFAEKHIPSAIAPIPDQTDCLWFIESVYTPGTTGRGTYSPHSVVCVNAQGEVTASADITALVGERDISCSAGVALPDGRYFICVEDLICLFDSDAKLVFEEKTDILQNHPEFMTSPEAVLTSSGQIALLLEENGKRKLYLVNENARKPEFLGIEGNFHIADGDDFFDLYLFDGSLWGYTISTGEKTKILTFSDHKIQSGNIVRILPVGISETGAPKFACYEIFGRQILPTLLEQRIKEPEKITLRLGTRDVGFLSSAVSEFNRQNADFQIEIVEYATEEDPLGTTNFSVAIAMGDIPDILDIAYLPEYSLIQKKLLRDLTPFMDADPDLSPDLFLPNIFDTLKYPDGAVYYLVPGFRVSTMYGLRSAVGERSAITYSEILAMMKADSGITRPISNCVQDQLSVHYFNVVDQFVDWNNLANCNNKLDSPW